MHLRRRLFSLLLGPLSDDFIQQVLLDRQMIKLRLGQGLGSLRDLWHVTLELGNRPGLGRSDVGNLGKSTLMR